MLQKPNLLADCIEALSDREALRPVGPKRFAILPNPLLGLVGGYRWRILLRK